jgi:hypothetical protein
MKLKKKKGLQTFQTFGQKEIKSKSFAVKGKRRDNLGCTLETKIIGSF